MLVCTLLGATVPLMEIAANENKASCSAGRLAEVLDKRERYKHVSRRRTAKKLKKQRKTSLWKIRRRRRIHFLLQLHFATAISFKK